MRFLSSLSLTKNKKIPVVLGMFAAVVGVLAVIGGANPAKVSAAACGSGNDIMTGGFSTANQFINKVDGNKELERIYADNDYGLTRAMYGSFKSSAREGYANKNGDIFVDGKKVGINSKSIGRDASCQGPGYFTKRIDGVSRPFYGNTNDRAFASDKLSVMVLFDANNQPAFVVIKNCGNPIKFTPVPQQRPGTLTCDLLQVTQDRDNPLKYTFTSRVNMSGSANVSYVAYTFGDGSDSVRRDNPATAVTHIYDSGGAKTAKVYVHGVAGGKDVYIAPAGNCQRAVSVPKPNYSCVSLVGALVDKSKNTYLLTATAAYSTGVTPKSVSVTYGDGKKQTVGMTGKTVSFKHDYPLSIATYSAVAAISFNAYGKAVTAAACKTTVSTTIPYCLGLAGAIVDKSKYQAQFTATAVLNGRTLKSADFTFGDGNSANGVQPKTANSVQISHNYSGSGTYDVVATLHFVADGKQYTSLPCRAQVTPEQIVSVCKPGIPVGDARCNPCLTNPDYSADDTEHCAVPQTELPNTGAGNTIAIFSAVVVGGFLIYRQVLYRQHKAAFVAAERGTSALPLADALDDQTPLSGTPFEPGHRSTFRRKRPF